MSTKKTKLAGALSIILILGLLCTGAGLFAAQSTKDNNEVLNHKTGNHQKIDHKKSNCKKGHHKEQPHKKTRCGNHQNKKMNCSKDQSN